MRIKKFTEFLNEWNIGGHWRNRTSLDHIESRAVAKTPNYKYGWECKELIKMKEDGSESGKISLEEFLKMTSLDKNTFEDRVKKSIHYLCNSDKARNTEYRDDLYRYIYLGKLAFPFQKTDKEGKTENLLFSPVLETIKEGKGNKIFGVIGSDNHRIDNGITILYFNEDATEALMLNKTYNDYRYRSKSQINKEQFKKNMWGGIDFLYTENFTLVIPLDSTWQKTVFNAVEKGETWSFPN